MRALARRSGVKSCRRSEQADGPRRLAGICAGLGLAWAMAHAAAADTAQPFNASEVAPGVFVHLGLVEEWQPGNAGDVANLGFVVGNRCVAVVDTGGTPQVGKRLLAAVRRATPLPICYVINTHAHPDHVLGDAAFSTLPGEPVAFVGSVRLGPALAAREKYFANALQRDFGLALSHADFVQPSVAVNDVLELDLGGRILELQAWPTAHTDHDLTVFDHQSRTLFLGDLLFVGHLPVVDGKLRGWLGVMDRLKAKEAALAVPGHGPPSADWPAVMQPQRNYLDRLLIETRAAIQKKMTIQAAVDAVKAPAEGEWKLVELFHRRNVTAAYAELEWED
jgi:quinoprotein relay system zinc metallohydrolase 2